MLINCHLLKIEKKELAQIIKCENLETLAPARITPDTDNEARNAENLGHREA